MRKVLLTRENRAKGLQFPSRGALDTHKCTDLLLSPVDLIPDVIYVLGVIDDVLIVSLALGFALRHAGMDVVEYR